MSKKMHGKGITRTLFVVTLVGLVLFALGGVALAAPPTTIGNVGQNGPTVPKLGDPVASQSEVQWVTVTISAPPASGFFKLVTDGALAGGGPAGTTVDIGVGATAAAVQLALAGRNATTTLPAIVGVYPVGTIAVVGGPTSLDYDAAGVLTGGSDGAYFYRVTWVGAQAGLPKATMSAVAGTTPVTGAAVTVDPYEDGATFAGRVQPHGGYSATTDYCLQCHTVHNAPGQGFSLLADTSVTAVCKTCHTIGVAISGNDPPADGTAIIPGPAGTGFPGVEAPTSMRGSYEVTGAAALSKHTLGGSTPPFASVTTMWDTGWEYGGFNAAEWTSIQAPAGAGTVDSLNGGLYCGSCHTPHGDFGQLVQSERAGFRTTADGGALLNDVDKWEELSPFYLGRNYRVLHYDGNALGGAGAWEACPPVNNAAYTASPPATPIPPTAADINAVAGGQDTVTQTAGGTATCGYATATDTEGESAYLYGYKLLTAYPNHQYNSVESWNMDASAHDGSRWCGTCHDKAIPSEYGGTFHNHPTGCTACHGNPNDGTSTDFPHTSTFSRLLKDYPDLLCVNCHTAGSLP